MNLYLFVLFWFFLLIFVYSNFLYPLVFSCFGFLAGRSTSSSDSSEQGLQPITLLVPAYNESAVILAKLKNIDTLEYPPGMLRVIVASDGSDDGTQGIVRSYQSTRPIELLDFQERRGKASIVNDALSQCTDPWVCLCDANVMFRSDALVRMATLLRLPRVGAVTGDVRLASDESDFGRGESLYYEVERAIQKGESFIGSVMGVDGGMYLMRRELFKPVAKDTILDDFTISMTVIQQGYCIRYEPTAIANENGTPSSEIEFGRRKRVARGAIQSISRGIYPSMFDQPVEFAQWFSHKLLRWLNPLVLMGVFLMNILLAFSSTWFQMLLGLEILAIGGAILAWLIPKLRGWPIIGLIYYFGLSHWAMLIGLFQGLSGKYSAVWNRTERKSIAS
jgi:cellulose synthase/poly-beta-1,6-N-acetylglucosamine synthase-like glycosyltransferase